MFELTAALSGAKTLVDIAKSGLDARDDSKVRRAVIDLQEKLFEAMSAALDSTERSAQLLARVAELERAKADVEAKLRERDSYVLTEIRSGAFVYASKPGEEGVPRHYLCQICFDGGKKSVLRSTMSASRRPFWTCAVDNGHSIRDTGETVAPLRI